MNVNGVEVPTTGDGKVVMEWYPPGSEEPVIERVYPCEANAWLVAHGKIPVQGMFNDEYATHYHLPEILEPGEWEL